MISLKTTFLALFSLALLSPAGWSENYYVDSRCADAAGVGTQQKPFQTIAQAMKLADGKGGEIHLAPGSGPYRENVVIRKGGLPDSPLILDGHGAVINLGEDVTAGPWTDTGNGWILERPVQVNDRPYVASPVFVNGLPVFVDHPRGTSPGAWHGGSVRYDEQKRLILTFPKGLTPQNSVIVLTGPNTMGCGIGLSGASNVTVRNLTTVFSANDGFNCHGSGKDVVFDGVIAIFNGDQGVSSHETYQVLVQNAEIAFNGTFGGGVTDINASVTTYRNVRIHQNRNSAFQLVGAHHVLDKVVSFGNPRGNLPKPSEKIEVIDSQDLGAVESDKTIPVLSPESQNSVVSASATFPETDRLNRFLQCRPPHIPVTVSK